MCHIQFGWPRSVAASYCCTNFMRYKGRTEKLVLFASNKKHCALWTDFVVVFGFCNSPSDYSLAFTAVIVRENGNICHIYQCRRVVNPTKEVNVKIQSKRKAPIASNTVLEYLGFHSFHFESGAYLWYKVNFWYYAEFCFLQLFDVVLVVHVFSSLLRGINVLSDYK